MNLKAYILIISLLFTACASHKAIVIDKPANKPPTQYQATQELGDSKFVFCDKDCNTITQKEIVITEPLPAAAAIPALLPKEVQASNKQFRVHFAFDSQELNSHNKKEIAEIKKYVAESASKHLTIVGKTDPIGAKKYNGRLAMQRAQRVKQSLLLQGLVINITTSCCIKDGAYSEARSADVTVLVSN